MEWFLFHPITNKSTSFGIKVSQIKFNNLQLIIVNICIKLHNLPVKSNKYLHKTSLFASKIIKYLLSKLFFCFQNIFLCWQHKCFHMLCLSSHFLPIFDFVFISLLISKGPAFALQTERVTERHKATF